MGKAIKYSEDFKKESVQIYLQGDESATAVAKALGVDRHTLYSWIRQFNNGIVVDEIKMCINKKTI